jgi:hypothetical protein
LAFNIKYDWKIICGKVSKTGKKRVTTNFNVMARHSSGEMEENQKELHEAQVSRREVRSITT